MATSACLVHKIDSNVTGLRFAEEVCLGQLPEAADTVWYPLEPNSYSDFGAENTLTARTPINDSRQRQKGIITDREASGGFNQDLTNSNTQRLMQGFMFAKERAIAVSKNLGATVDGYSVETGFVIGQLVYASGFENPANNGFSTVTDVDSGIATTDKTNMVDEPAKLGQTLIAVGVEVSAAVTIVGGFPVLTGANLPVVPSGSYVYIGDTAINSYDQIPNNGFKRVRASSAAQMQIDKSDAEMLAAPAKTVRIFFPRVLKNEQRALIHRTSYHIERTLGSLDGMDPPQSEYLKGSVAGEWALNITAADKIAADFTFTAQDSVERTQAEGLFPGARPELVETNAYNSSDNVKRLRVALAGSPTVAPEPLVGFLTEWNMTINNNLSGNKAIGRSGSFEITAGTFAVSGQLEAYFSSVEAVRAVRQNADVTLDAILVTPNTDVGLCGVVIDMPLVGLGDARLSVELDQPVMLPLTAEAARGKKVSPLLDHTLAMCFFDYLPSSAM